jgi:hypothetical protein
MQRASAAMLGFGVLVAFAYASQRTLIFPWYRPLYLLPLLGGGLLSLASAPPATRALALLFLGLCGTRASAEALSMTSGFLTRTRAAWSEHASGLRVQRYLRLGASLRERFPNASVLAPEIGALGWSFRGRILDGLGLATPAALAFHPLPVPSMRTHGSEGALPPEAIARFQPDLIVSLDVFGTAARRALQSGELRGYREIETVPALCGIDGAEVSEHVRLWEARETWVYVREGLASSIHTGQ